MHKFEVFYDGDCPLCLREINVLRWFDKKQAILFTDIADPKFDETSTGLSWDTLMDRIHGRKADGTIVEGVDVFREIYAALGAHWLVWLTKLPGISNLLEFGYKHFAKNRLRLTGRCKDGVCKVERKK